MDVKISKNVKLKGPSFWQNYFFLESYTIEIIGNDDSTRVSRQSTSETTCDQI